MSFLSAIGAIGELVTAPIARMQARRQRKDELEAAAHQAVLDDIHAGNRERAEWELEQVRGQGASWKDEFVTVAVWLPFLTLFGSAVFGWGSVMDRVLVAFDYMARTPDWYQWVFLAVTLAAVGIKIGRAMAGKT